MVSNKLWQMREDVSFFSFSLKLREGIAHTPLAGAAAGPALKFLPLQQLSWEEVEALQPHFKVTPASKLLGPAPPGSRGMFPLEAQGKD